MGKPRVKGADAHRSQPSGGPSGGSSSGGSSGGGGGRPDAAPSSNGEVGTPPDVDADSAGGGRFSLDTGTKRRLLIGGGVALGAVALYFLLKNRSSDRGGGRRASADDGPGPGGDGGGPGEKGFPNINKTPEDPLAADEEAIEWIKNPEEKAREVARDEMEEEELIE